MSEGKLVRWNAERGFGFIQPDEGGPEVFVHIKRFQSEPALLAVGHRVKFEQGINSRNGKPEAHNVSLLDQ